MTLLIFPRSIEKILHKYTPLIISPILILVFIAPQLCSNAYAQDNEVIKYKDLGSTTGGINKKKYPTKVINGKKTKLIPPEDILMEKVVQTPSAPKAEGTSIRINLANQRAWLFKDGKPVLVSSITPGKKSSPTPKGRFHIINKHKQWTSTIYHVPMPYFLRLNPGYFGLHQGAMKVNPASHGCIRLPQKEASEFFALAKIGDPVWID